MIVADTVRRDVLCPTENLDELGLACQGSVVDVSAMKVFSSESYLLSVESRLRSNPRKMLVLLTKIHDFETLISPVEFGASSMSLMMSLN